MNKYDSLRLENQLCFPIYAAGKEIVKRYHPILDELDLTYTQYITMMVLWQTDGISVKECGDKLFLDSGTLTPLLKSMEKKGYVKRCRSEEDERRVLVYLTDEGRDLRESALAVPEQVGKCVNLTHEEAVLLYKLLYKFLGNITE